MDSDSGILMVELASSEEPSSASEPGDHDTSLTAFLSPLFDDVLLCVFSFLSPEDLFRIGTLSRHFRLLSSSVSLWRPHAADLVSLDAHLTTTETDDPSQQPGQPAHDLRVVSLDEDYVHKELVAGSFGQIPSWVLDADPEATPREYWIARMNRSGAIEKIRRFLVRELAGLISPKDGIQNHPMKCGRVCERGFTLFFFGVVPIFVLLGMIAGLIVLVTVRGNNVAGFVASGIFGLLMCCCFSSLVFYWIWHEICDRVLRKRRRDRIHAFVEAILPNGVEVMSKTVFYSHYYSFGEVISRLIEEKVFFVDYGPVIAFFFALCCMFPVVGLGIGLTPLIGPYSIIVLVLLMIAIVVFTIVLWLVHRAIHDAQWVRIWNPRKYLPVAIFGTGLPCAVSLAFGFLMAVLVQFFASQAAVRQILATVAAGIYSLLLALTLIYGVGLLVVYVVRAKTSAEGDPWDWPIGTLNSGHYRNIRAVSWGSTICTPFLFLPLHLAACLYFWLVRYGYGWVAVIFCSIFFCLGLISWIPAFALCWIEDNKYRHIVRLHPRA